VKPAILARGMYFFVLPGSCPIAHLIVPVKPLFKAEEEVDVVDFVCSG